MKNYGGGEMMQALNSNMSGHFEANIHNIIPSLYEDGNNVNAFLSDIKLLLDNDKRSHASDLLTGFLFELHGRPVGISLPRLRTTSTVDEIVSCLEEALQIDDEIAVKGTNRETSTFNSELRLIPTQEKGTAQQFIPATTRAAGTPATLKERIQFEAEKLGSEFGWNTQEITLLAEIFTIHGYGPTRLALDYLINLGMTSNELSLAHGLRQLWAESPEYAMAIPRRMWNLEIGTAGYDEKLSWRQALKIVRFFPCGTDLCEIEYLLDKAFADWFEMTGLRRSFTRFTSYLQHLAELTTGEIELLHDGEQYYGEEWNEDIYVPRQQTIGVMLKRAGYSIDEGIFR